MKFIEVTCLLIFLSAAYSLPTQPLNALNTTAVKTNNSTTNRKAVTTLKDPRVYSSGFGAFAKLFSRNIEVEVVTESPYDAHLLG